MKNQMLTIFEKIEKGYIVLPVEHANLIMAWLKMAFNEGVDTGKAHLKADLREVYTAIDNFLVNSSEK